MSSRFLSVNFGPKLFFLIVSRIISASCISGIDSSIDEGGDFSFRSLIKSSIKSTSETCVVLMYCSNSDNESM